MARARKQYSVLQGLVNDVSRAYDDEEPLLAQLVDYIERVASEMEADLDHPDDTADDNQGDVGGQGLQGREADAPRPRRHDAGSEAHRAAPSGLGRQLDSVPGDVGAQAQPELFDVRSRHLGAPAPGLSAPGVVRKREVRNG